MKIGKPSDNKKCILLTRLVGIMVAVLGMSLQSQSVLAANQCDIQADQLIKCDLSHQNLEQHDFSKKRIVDVNFSSANLFGANFQRSVLINVNFSDADLFGSYFVKASLTNVEFQGADISEAEFTGVSLSETNLSRVGKSGNVVLGEVKRESPDIYGNGDCEIKVERERKFNWALAQMDYGESFMVESICNAGSGMPYKVIKTSLDTNNTLVRMSSDDCRFNVMFRKNGEKMYSTNEFPTTCKAAVSTSCSRHVMFNISMGDWYSKGLKVATQSTPSGVSEYQSGSYLDNDRSATKAYQSYGEYCVGGVYELALNLTDTGVFSGDQNIQTVSRVQVPNSASQCSLSIHTSGQMVASCR